MLFLISPAKSLDYETPAGDVPATQPLFAKESARLIDVLKTKSAAQVASLMDLSGQLSALNVERYRAWTPKVTQGNSKQAILAFDGDVYGGLDAKNLKPAELAWTQDHVCILSGLYGVLRPFDLMQPYRLEMGTRLATPQGKDLYQFWGTRISDYLNTRLAADKTPVIVNCASQEYFRSVDLKALKARVVECVFEDWKPDGWKVISFNAKRARGLMVRYAAGRRFSTPRGLEGFNLEGWRFDAPASRADRLVFRRKLS